MPFRRIVFDLDGTLVDASDRMYLLFRELVPESRLSKDEYWALKRDKVSHRDIIVARMGCPEARFADFERQWLNQIESPKSIARDRLYPGVDKILSSLRSKGFGLYLVTARQFPDVVESEVVSLGIHCLFDGVFATGPDRDKRRALEGLVPFGKGDIFVGDTGKDVQLGKSLGGFTVAVAGGFMSAERLREYSPDVILGGIEEINGCFCVM